MTEKPTLPLRCEMPTSRDRPGSYNFTTGYSDPDDDPPRGMTFCCPCGCGELGHLYFRGRLPAGEPPRPSWEWDGNRSHPTLEPSIQRNSGCRWHGFLVRGYWVLNRDDAPLIADQRGDE